MVLANSADPGPTQQNAASDWGLYYLLTILIKMKITKQPLNPWEQIYISQQTLCLF